MKIQSFISLALLLPLGACVIVDSDTESGTESATSTGTTSASTSTTSTTADTTSETSGTMGGTASAGSTTADATATDPTSTTDGTTGSTTADSDSDSDGTSTGSDPEAILESCKAACEVLLECYPDEFEEFDLCVELCVDESTPVEPDAECEAATIAVNKCLGTASCEDFEGRDFCGAEQAKEDAACGSDECFGSGGSDENGTECSISEECVGDYKHELLCTVDTCECFVDDEKTQECEPKMNLCADFDPSVLEDYALECCGW